MAGSLIPLYRVMHNRGYFWGRSVRHHLDAIANLVTSSGAETLLDYGCGKGHQYTQKRCHSAWGNIKPTLYDPGVPELSNRPKGTFDGVICTDVLEHIPEDELDDVIGDLVGYAKMWCFMSICCQPARKTFPDGRNVHVTIQPKEWWVRRLEAAFAGRAAIHMSFDRDKGAVDSVASSSPYEWKKGA